jgi:hypothetical protein
MFKIILDMPLPHHLEAATDDIEDIIERDSTIQWKIKAQAARITFRLFSRYSNPGFSNGDKEEKAWCEYFQAEFSETLCESHLIGSKTLNFVIKLVTAATKINRTMSKMLPFIDNILYETVIPLMLTSARDIRLFEEDPIEFIRKQ